jgi:Domain of unknown function (DUF4136)
MKRPLLLAFVSFFLGVSLVRAQDVRYNFDSQANFAAFKTHHWVEIKGADRPNQLVDKQIRDALNAGLATKGLKETDSDSADLYIAYQTAVNTEKQLTSYSTGGGYGPGWGYAPGWGHGWYGGGMSSGMTTSSTSTIYVGQLDVDMYESAKKDLVWRGTASKTIDTKAKPEKQQKNLAKAVAKLLKHYPPTK